MKRDRPSAQVASDLVLLTKSTVVIDDFHYLPESEQLRIVRGLRAIVFEGVPAILLSVPHRVYDEVRAEPEMTRRVVPVVSPCGPKTSISDGELLDWIRATMKGEPPAGHEVTRVLDQMTQIARKGKGEPVYPAG